MVVKLGATGEYPMERLHPSDEGALNFVIGTRGGNVFVDFGKPVAWLEMPPDQARALAGILIARANLIDRGGK